ncbi:DUF2254 domain-containing protein [Thalassobacillus pellis]|uniref:DUF2254 domain-containing protein n=1 Tax=Thalassobacillus pellis TaxID=748008 RepID=UPI0019605D27|nr:DUF2254 domain-containing protein [Thalassobacillus pellis]MBM7553905.1 putative membrane protein [Thalassobacillus pellis]
MELYGNLWVTPIIYGLLSVLLLVAAVILDTTINSGKFIPPALSIEYQLTRTILSTLSGGILSLTTFTFYGVLAALTTFSVQFSPRILQNFMRNKVTQRTLGIFIGSFTYVLLCLFFIDKESTFFFMPVLAILFTMLTMATFIIFINHIVDWLQVTNMTEDMKEESAIVAKNLLVKEMDAYRVIDSSSIKDQIPESREQGCSIYVEESGYIQTIDFINLIKEAEKDDLIIELHYKVGNYAFVSTPFLTYWPNGGHSIDESKYSSMIRIGKNQNEVQDIEFSLNKLVEVAIRAIGSNDPKTATRTIYQIGDLLIKISQLSFFTPYLADEKGNLRIILDNLEFKDYLYIGLSSIRHYARTNVILTVEILKVLHAIAKVRKKHDCTPVWEFAVYTTRSLEINYIHSLDREKLYSTLLDMAITTGHEMEYNKLVRKMMRNITDEDDRKEIERKIPLKCY